MPVPDFQTIMRPLLECGKKGEEVKTSECIELLATHFNLTAEEIDEMLPSGRQPLFFNRVHWARTYLGKAKLIESTRRGYFKITNIGLDVLKTGPERITINYLKNFEGYREWVDDYTSNEGDTDRKDSDLSSDNNISPEERIEKSHVFLDEQLKKDILQNLYEVTPSMFERIIVDLLIAMGYGGGRAEMGRALGQTNDGGVDGVIKEDELGLDVIYIQAKKYDLESSIGRPAIQSFVGSLEGFNATKGVFVTTGSFASTVKEYVEKIHKKIVLIDGKRLATLMIRHNVGVRIKNTYELKTLDEDYFLE